MKPADSSQGFQDDLECSTCRLETTEGKVQNFDRSFQQGSSDEGTVLSKKTDPNIILNLAEQRVQSLFDKFSADKTVRLTSNWPAAAAPYLTTFGGPLCRVSAQIFSASSQCK